MNILCYSKRVQPFFVIFGALFFCLQTGAPRSADGKDRPSVNVVGSFTDVSSKKYELEYITIAGRYREIPVFQRPPNAAMNPDINMTKIDLAEVQKIELISPEILLFNDREYLGITVFFRGSLQTKNEYIVERRYHIRGHEPLGAGAGYLDREFSFLALKSLQIDGVKGEHGFNKQVSQPLDDLTITKTKKILEEIEHAAQQMPIRSDGAFNDLKSQLLHLIDELKRVLYNWFK